MSFKRLARWTTHAQAATEVVVPVTGARYTFTTGNNHQSEQRAHTATVVKHHRLNPTRSEAIMYPSPMSAAALRTNMRSRTGFAAVIGRARNVAMAAVTVERCRAFLSDAASMMKRPYQGMRARVAMNGGAPLA